MATSQDICPMCHRFVSWHRFGFDTNDRETIMTMTIKLDDGTTRICNVYIVKDPNRLLELL